MIVIAFDSGRRFRETYVIKTGKRGAVYVLFVEMKITVSIAKD